MAAKAAYCFELNSLSGTKVLKMATKELPESNDRWGISFYIFYLHENPVSSGGKQLHNEKIRFICFLKFIVEKIVNLVFSA